MSDDDSNSKQVIAVLGPQLSFTDLARRKVEDESGASFEVQYYPTIERVIQAVKKGWTEKGIIPLRNTIGGEVDEVQHALNQKEGIEVEREIILDVHHCLMIPQTAEPEDIKIILSHKQAFHQTKNFLKRRFSHAELVEMPSTIFAMREVSELARPAHAAIGSREAAEACQLKIVAENIEDASSQTTFAIIRKSQFIPGVLS